MCVVFSREFIDPQTRLGIQSSTLPSLNRILKGFRQGELSIITGATGVGKTTVLAQLSLDYCAQGVNTLWGSFEIKNHKLARTMINQFANKDLSVEFAKGMNTAGQTQQDQLAAHNPHLHTRVSPSPEALRKFNEIADRFESLPLYFMKFFGSCPVEQVLDAMEYAVYVYDVEHILIDNLQFMLSTQGVRGYEKFDMQNDAISLFREFATAQNVHVSLVVHPRKENDGAELNINSVFGPSKVTQEADNVMIIQSPSPPVQSFHNVGRDSGYSRSVTPPQSYIDADGGVSYVPSKVNRPFPYSSYRRIQIVKNRFDGALGVIPFEYDRASCRIHEVNPFVRQSGSNSQVKGEAVQIVSDVDAPSSPLPSRAPRSSFTGPQSDASFMSGSVHVPPVDTTQEGFAKARPISLIPPPQVDAASPSDEQSSSSPASSKPVRSITAVVKKDAAGRVFSPDDLIGEKDAPAAKTSASSLFPGDDHLSLPAHGEVIIKPATPAKKAPARRKKAAADSDSALTDSTAITTAAPSSSPPKRSRKKKEVIVDVAVDDVDVLDVKTKGKEESTETTEAKTKRGRGRKSTSKKKD